MIFHSNLGFWIFLPCAFHLDKSLVSLLMEYKRLLFFSIPQLFSFSGDRTKDDIIPACWPISTISTWNFNNNGNHKKEPFVFSISRTVSSCWAFPRSGRSNFGMTAFCAWREILLHFSKKINFLSCEVMVIYKTDAQKNWRAFLFFPSLEISLSWDTKDLRKGMTGPLIHKSIAN